MEDTHLGQKSVGSVKYDPSLLRKIERQQERTKSGIGPVLPFYGVDFWNAYEFTFLTRKGIPKQYILRIVYSADSPYIVESKSLKLYLNSFAMENTWDTISEVIQVIKTDLETLLSYRVHISDIKSANIEFFNPTQELPYWEDLDKLKEDFEIDKYTRDSNLLVLQKPEGKCSRGFYSRSLRSNCKVTHQPDYGDIFISMRGESIPTSVSLYKYIVSYRNENHFHEEIVEQIYTDLWELCKPEELLVCAKYTRRGGIDINPVRYSHIPQISFFGNGFEFRNQRQ